MIINPGISQTPETTRDAIQLQKTLAQRVSLKDDFSEVKLIAGVDVGYDKPSNRAKAALVVMDKKRLEPEISLVDYAPVTFPYISGLLSFRELPAIMKVLSHLAVRPDLIMVDGQGIAHPRRIGIASHLGVLLDIPTIGVAKTKLCGTYEDPAMHKGAQSPLHDKGEYIGTVLRSRDNVKPLFISPGHKISVESATELVLQCLGRYRLPEPTRMADKLSKVTRADKLA